jgi:hypothetical protein
MKIIIFSVIGLAVGTLGGTAFGGLKEKAVLIAEMESVKAAAAQEPTHETQEPPDSPVEGESAGQEQAHAAESPADDPAPSPHGEETSQAVPQGIDVPQGTSDTLPQEGPPETLAGEPTAPEMSAELPAEEGGGSARLAKIFGAMKAPDAAKVLQNLDDEEVQAILFHLTDRKAAEILGNFEPARAATLSRSVLRSSGGEG